ncbi:MAG TPA: PrsW family glutamic-type intramembrane protease [Candidatus Paceibacterota bacterium]|nr:PrsW family glutamic-type intramembrane protease [Candidatus Paceibacterota bacterium]
MIPSGTTIFFALLGGILPALLWLWFWLREDKLHPEPRWRLILAFVGGMIAVPLVYPFERLSLNILGWSIWTVIAWAAIEEIAKYIAAHFTALRSQDFKWPIDALEYLITTALGFAAVENTLFILSPLTNGDIGQSIVTGNLRFIGATLVHVTSSAVLGYFIGRKFYARKWISKAWARILGLTAAIALHSVFNYFIIYRNSAQIFIIFGFVWAAAIVLLILFEQIKKLPKTKS